MYPFNSVNLGDIDRYVGPLFQQGTFLLSPFFPTLAINARGKDGHLPFIILLLKILSTVDPDVSQILRIPFLRTQKLMVLL